APWSTSAGALAPCERVAWAGAATRASAARAASGSERFIAAAFCPQPQPLSIPILRNGISIDPALLLDEIFGRSLLGVVAVAQRPPLAPAKLGEDHVAH